jgi:hypothetical protein
LPHFATAVGARHCCEARGAVQTHRDVSAKVLRSRPGPQPKSSIVNGGSP